MQKSDRKSYYLFGKGIKKTFFLQKRQRKINKNCQLCTVLEINRFDDKN